MANALHPALRPGPARRRHRKRGDRPLVLAATLTGHSLAGLFRSCKLTRQGKASKAFFRVSKKLKKNSKQSMGVSASQQGSGLHCPMDLLKGSDTTRSSPTQTNIAQIKRRLRYENSCKTLQVRWCLERIIGQILVHAHPQTHSTTHAHTLAH